MSSTRRPATRSKWHPPPPPTPKILQLPRRIKLQPKKPAPAHRNLGSLIAEEIKNGADRGSGEKRWRAEAEMLRQECNVLRMERDAALRKLEKNHVSTFFPHYIWYQSVGFLIWFEFVRKGRRLTEVTL